MIHQIGVIISYRLEVLEDAFRASAAAAAAAGGPAPGEPGEARRVSYD